MNTSDTVIFSADLPDGTTVELSEEMLNTMDVVLEPGGYFHILNDGKMIRLQLLHADYLNREFHFRWHALEFRITLRDRVETIVHKLGLKLEADGRVNEISAPMPGLVLKLLVSEGQSVSKGDPLVILEAMKMENVLAAPNDAEIDTVSVQQGDTVDKGQLLIKLI